MSTPAGITRRTVTAGVFSTIESGDDLGVTITARSSQPELVWAATGEALVSDLMSADATTGTEASIALIPTDLPGWLLHGAVVDVTGGKQSHVYNVTVQPWRLVNSKKVPVGQRIMYRNVVVSSSSSDPIDLDTAAQASGSTGTTVTVPDVVRYGTPQTLTDAQKAQAQANIGVTGGGGAGTVQSVNGVDPDSGGNVELTPGDIGAATSTQGAKADTAVQPGSLATVATTGAYSDLSGKPTLGTAASHAATDFDTAGAAAAAQAAAATDATNKVATETTARTAAVSAEATARANADALLIPLTQKGAANGVATLDGSGTVPAAQLPSYVDDVLEYANLAAFPTTGEAGKIYVTLDTNKTYRWSGSGYVEISQSLALGTTSSTAYPGDQGAANAAAISAETSRATTAEGLLVPKTRTLAGLDLSSDRTAAAIKTALGITESDVANLTTDLAGKVPTTRTLAGLDLSADRTAAAIKTALGITESDVANLTSDLAALATRFNTTAVKTANYTAAAWDLVRCDTSGGAFTVTLPAASSGKVSIAVKLTTAGNTLNLALTGTDHFNTSSGPTTGTLTQTNQGIIAVSDGSGVWTIVADDLPLSVMDGRYVLTSLVTTKGDLLAATGSGALARVGVGSNGQVLTADSTQAAGVKWAAAAGGTQINIGFCAPPKTMLTNKLMHVPISSGPLAQSNQASTQGAMWLSPLPVTEACTLSQVAAAISGAAGSTGAVFRIGIYPFTPGASPLYDSGALSATSLATVSASLSLALTPGLYLVAIVSQGSPATAPNFRVGLPTSGWNPVLAYDSASYLGGDSPVWAYQMAGVTGALPALGTLTTVTGTANYMPIVGLTF